MLLRARSSIALAAVLTAPLWPSTAIARPETPPNVKTGKGKIRASRTEQDYRAVRLLHVQGRGAWPVCG
jgi:hypothetical protein